jgi:hypothetical protein
MFFGLQRPADITWTVSASGLGGSGAALDASTIANAKDDRPATLAEFTWPTGGSQTTGTVMHIKGDWSARAFAPRLVGLLNVSLPVGTKVSASFRRPGDTLGTYPYAPTIYNNGQRIVAGARGERTCWILLPTGASACLGVDIQISNDVNGSASIPPGLSFTSGELVVCGGADWDIQPGWSQYEVDPTVRDFDPVRRPYAAPGTVYRELDFTFATDTLATYVGDSTNPTAMHLRDLIAAIDRGQSAVYVARYVDANNTFDAVMLHSMAFIGTVQKLPRIGHKAGGFYSSGSTTVIESPIPT